METSTAPRRRKRASKRRSKGKGATRRSKDLVTLDEPTGGLGKHRTLLGYLEAQGNISLTSQGQMIVARNRYVTRGWSKAKSARAARVTVSIFDRWCMLFAWEEDRSRRLFQKWQSLSKIGERPEPDIEERADRLFGSLESVAEQLLLDAQDGRITLEAKDLSALASTLKTSHESRRLIHGKSKPVEKKEISLNVEGDVGFIHTIGEMLVDEIKPAVIEDQEKVRVNVEVGNIEDAEFEKQEQD